MLEVYAGDARWPCTVLRSGIGYYMYEEPLRDTRGVERSQGVWAYKPPMAAEVPVELLCVIMVLFKPVTFLH